MAVKNCGEGKWSFGKISLVLLILFSTSDLILNHVDAQMESLNAFDDYDALSAEVIRPAFRYRSSVDRKGDMPKLGLRSAAISSVTTTLSPILSFTVGVDENREGYWANGMIGSFSSVLEQARHAFTSSKDRESSSASFLTIPRGGSSVSSKTMHAVPHKKRHHEFALSSKEPFVPLKDIAKLTLREVALAFRYALESTRKGFNKSKFLSSSSPRVRKVFEQMSEAAALSRGKNINAPTTGIEPLWGDIDALHFCAAMRMFAEWRVLRQVPEGYKGYAVGMRLGQKDIIQNVAKIEEAVHNFIDHQEQVSLSSQVEETTETTSPTLRELLQYEVDLNIHGSKLPRLKERSGAMGLLWVRRQLHYQTALFGNVIRIPSRFKTTRAAVSAAYSEVYDKFHGWTVQKIFNYSFQAAPEVKEIIRFMNPQRLAEVSYDAEARFLGAGADTRQISYTESQQGGNLLERFIRHLGNEWAKLARSVIQIFDKSSKDRANLTGYSEEMGISVQDEMDSYINKKMEADAQEQILEYLEIAQPLLSDLSNLFDEFNMDDPTKV
eukprot:scaffold22586_cov138-Cylindrotheca_fusiformis.AAC.13